MDTPKQTPRPEQEFFDNPAMDHLMGTVMALAQEHYVLKDRVRALEAELAKTNTLDPAALDREPSDEERAATAVDRAAFTEALLKPWLGQQDSVGTPGRLSLKSSS